MKDGGKDSTNYFHNHDRFPSAGSLRMEITTDVCLQREARDDFQKAFNTVLRAILKDDRKATESVSLGKLIKTLV